MALPTSAQIDSVMLDSTIIGLRGSVNGIEISGTQLTNKPTLGEVLTQEALVFIKPASGSSLSTISIRGGTAEQSPVYWNGLNLQNTLNGTIDVNLLPTFIFDDVRVNNTSATNIGGGSIAGSISLKNDKPDTSRDIQVQLGTGSFGLFNAAFKSTIPTKSSIWSVVGYHRSIVNNYPIISRQMSPQVQRLKHARYDLQGLLVQNQITLKKSNPLNIRLWAQQSDRQIPSTTLEGLSNKYQSDHSIRLQTDWSVAKGKNQLKIIAGSFNERLQYKDSVTKIYNTYNFSNNSLLFHYKRQITSQLTGGIDAEVRHFDANADTFYNQQRFEFSQGGHFKIKTKQSIVYAGLRWVQFNRVQDKPTLITLRINRKIKKWFDVTGSFATNYRLPTFNSLYWNPGGNANLGPERSSNAEVGVMLHTKGVQWSTSVYSVRINDQIRWLPGDNGIFEARQIKYQTQWNRGIETKLKYQRDKFVFRIGATSMESFVDGDQLRLQQTYVPKVQANTSLRYEQKSWSVFYGITYTGNRYTDTKNEEFLPEIILHRAGVDARHKVFAISLVANNLMNTFYTVLPFRPNPPFNFQFNISYKLINNKKK
jgi:vitamin B12 transporter